MRKLNLARSAGLVPAGAASLGCLHLRPCRVCINCRVLANLVTGCETAVHALGVILYFPTSLSVGFLRQRSLVLRALLTPTPKEIGKVARAEREEGRRERAVEV